MLNFKQMRSGLHLFGVRWQAQRDTALDSTIRDSDPKRRRRFAVPAHSKLVLVLLLLGFSSLLTGCRRDMQDQPKTIAYRASAFYRDGTGSRPLVEGTVPRGHLRENHEFFTGKKLKAGDLNKDQQYQRTTQPSPNAANAFPDDVETIPMPMTKDDLNRGQERYNIYCSVCHGMTGYGDGIVARRGFNRPSPASYHQERLQNAPVGHFFDVMTTGWGAMPNYAQQVSVEDRWRIAAYIVALQLSQRKPGGNPTVTNTGGNPTVREGANSENAGKDARAPR